MTLPGFLASEFNLWNSGFQGFLLNLRLLQFNSIVPPCPKPCPRVFSPSPASCWDIRATPMKLRPVPVVFLGLAASVALAASSGKSRELAFEKLTLTGEYWRDGVNAADINGDGKMDVIAGPFWYEGPTFKTAHAFYEPVPQPVEEKPTNSMFSFPYDFNGDGAMDILVLGRVLFHEAFW